MRKQRDANFELMRLLMLLLVIALHVVAPFRMSRWDKFEPNWIFTDTLASIARLCTNCFVLISGYFYSSAIGKRASRTVPKILLPMLFYIPFYLFLELNLGTEEAFRRVFLGLITNTYNMYHLWFTQAFLVLALLAPMLSYGLENAGRKTHRMYVWVLLTISSIMPTFVMLTGLEWIDERLFISRIMLFITLFVIGAYVRKYPPKMNIAVTAVLLAAAQLAVIYGSRLYHSRYSPLNRIKLWRGEIESLNDPAAVWIEHSGLNTSFADPSNIVIMAASVLTLILFSKIRLKSRIIPKLSRHVFGAYIVHVFVIELFNRIDYGRFSLWSSHWHESAYYPLFILVWILAVFAASILINMLFTFIYRLLIALLGPGRS